MTAQDLSDEAMMDLVRDCGAASVKVSVVPDHIDALGPSVEVDDIEGITVLGLNPPVLSRSSRFLKRPMDVVGAPLRAPRRRARAGAVAVAIKLDSPGPGPLPPASGSAAAGRRFRLVKFRTMVRDAEAAARGAASRRASDPDWLLLDHDPRITRVGRFLRRDQPRRAAAALERAHRAT